MKKIAVILLLLIFSASSFACTTFLLNDNGHFYFGRNYDWITGNGMVMVNARNVQKTGAASGSVLSWTSRYGSITFNQYGKEFPTGGMNEKGLVVELMWLEGSKYPERDSRPVLNVLQWIQYQLDNHSTIDEVIATDKKVRIKLNDIPLHYLVADASGKAATIEFLDGKMVVHKNDSLKFAVLTNTKYSESLVKTKDVVDGKKEISLPDNSLQRFAQACSMVSHFNAGKANALDYSFSILNKVSQGDYTKWSIVYDISAKQIHFITNANKNRRSLGFADFNFDCGSSQLALDMNIDGKGNVATNFKKLDFETNKNLVETSAKQTSSILQLPEAVIKGTVDYFNKTSCQ